MARPLLIIDPAVLFIYTIYDELPSGAACVRGNAYKLTECVSSSPPQTPPSTSTSLTSTSTSTSMPASPSSVTSSMSPKVSPLLKASKSAVNLSSPRMNNHEYTSTYVELYSDHYKKYVYVKLMARTGVATLMKVARQYFRIGVWSGVREDLNTEMVRILGLGIKDIHFWGHRWGRRKTDDNRFLYDAIDPLISGSLVDGAGFELDKIVFILPMRGVTYGAKSYNVDERPASILDVAADLKKTMAC